MAGPEGGWRLQLHQLAAHRLALRESTKENVPAIQGRAGQTGVCFDFHLQYQGEPWYNPQASQGVDATKSSPGAFIRGLQLRHAETPAPEVLLLLRAEAALLTVTRGMTYSCYRRRATLSRVSAAHSFLPTVLT